MWAHGPGLVVDARGGKEGQVTHTYMYTWMFFRQTSMITATHRFRFVVEDFSSLLELVVLPIVMVKQLAAGQENNAEFSSNPLLGRRFNAV